MACLPTQSLQLKSSPSKVETQIVPLKFAAQVLPFKCYSSNFAIQKFQLKFCPSNDTAQILPFKFYSSNFAIQLLQLKFCMLILKRWYPNIILKLFLMIGIFIFLIEIIKLSTILSEVKMFFFCSILPATKYAKKFLKMDWSKAKSGSVFTTLTQKKT